MNFRTEIKLGKSLKLWDIEDRISLIGSCFSENIGNKLSINGFLCDINPFGILYNPISIAQCLDRVSNLKFLEKEDLLFSNGYYKSYYHHGDFRAKTMEECLEIINKRIEISNSFLQNSNYLILTLGSAWIYKYKGTNNIVGNCHKVPGKEFEKSILSLEEIISSLKDSINQFFKINKTENPRVILTISPIRHWKDGFRENQISKSLLHIGVDEIIKSDNRIEYFPSYELVMDDLRDYRFYKEDMLHPNSIAIDYIWEKFSNTYFSDKTLNIAMQYTKLNKMESHLAFNPDSPEYKNHLRKTEELRKELSQIRLS